MDGNRLFAKYIGEKIAVYGLGAETKKALESLTVCYKVIGLLDSFKEEGELYGQPILSLGKVIEAGTKLIVVVARPGSCRAIARKIADRCRQEGLALMDIRGKDLLEVKDVLYDLSGVKGITREGLRERTSNAEVISFDLFDTLVMRQVLSPEDVVELVNYKLREREIIIKDFCKRRTESEKELARHTVPTLTEIYRNMLLEEEGENNRNITPEELADLEWELDFGLLVPRMEVCDFLREAVMNGKSVYIVSDTYYGKRQLEMILQKCGIKEYTDVLASCDCRTDKRRNLYKILRERGGDRKYFHIGDDVTADTEAAARWGIDACRLPSGVDLWEIMGGIGLSEYISTFSDRLKAGMFVARFFNSPFQFEKEDGSLEIKDIYDIGYLLSAPVISDFVLWFHEKLEQEKLQNIWFGARDGYLIKKMYALLQQTYHKVDESVYFLTSRTAAIRAGMYDDDDIKYVDEMKFSGTLEENLKERFGIVVDETAKEDILSDEDGLMKYRNVILRNACAERENYRKYIAKCNNRKGNTAFFDFVAKGTTQMYIQRLVDEPMKGFYFLQLETAYMKDKGVDICSFGEGSLQDAIFDEYYILETILTAPHPSVLGFDENGQPIYALETRRDSDICCLERVQDGILDYFKIYLKLCPAAERHMNKGLDSAFLKLFHKIRITDEDFMKLIIEDPFFNRVTNMVDVI